MISDDIRLLIAVSLPCLTVLVGILVNNHRITDLQTRVETRIVDLQTSMNQRFDDLTRFVETRFQLQDGKLYRVEQVLDARLKHLEDK
jgi:hypothetical protein